VSKRLDTPNELNKWLIELLESHDGQMPAKEVTALAVEARCQRVGPTAGTLERAGISSWRTCYGLGFGWVWSLHT
jgi:hypothetical protein